MSVLDWILVAIVCIFALIPFFLLICVALYCLFKIMSGIDEIFCDKQETIQESEDKE